MRLTLRTLLAYLDDVLEPSQTKEIGQKIQESPVAAALVSRIREVIRRRRLASPDVDGAAQGVDPNVVARYLDNTLPEDRVADIERVCLESDVHLAEVAATHQILTLVLGEPLDVPQQRLDRFYALGPVSLEARQSLGPAETAARWEEPVRTTAASAATREFHEGLPDYLKPSPWSQRFGPMVGVAIVVIAAVAALALDRDLARTLIGLRSSTPVAETSESLPAETTPPVRPASPKGAAEPAAPTASPKPTSVAARTDSPLSALPEGIDPAPPPDAPDPAVPGRPAEGAPTVPATAMPTSPSTAPTTAAVVPPAPTQVATATTPAPAIPMPPEPAPPPPPPRVSVPMQYASTEGVVIRYEPNDKHWFVQPLRSELHAGETFACPEPFEANFVLDDGRVQATLLGHTVVTILPPTPERRIRLALHRGRVIFTRGAVAGVDDPVPVEVTVGQQGWALNLMQPGSSGAVEMQIVRPTGLPFPKSPNWHRLALFASRGSILVTGPNAKDDLVAAGQITWLSRPEGEPDPSADPSPAWLVPEQRSASATLRRYSLLFEREFDIKSAVDMTIPALAKDPRPKIAELATRCLATTESYRELVSALVQSEHAEARAAAAEGLRDWLVQDADRVPILQNELRRHYPGDESTAVGRLLIGFSPADAQDRLTSLQVVEWLRSNFVEVRELAIEQLEYLTGRRYDYRPLGSPSQREPGVQRWEAHVEREGAIIAPK